VNFKFDNIQIYDLLLTLKTANIISRPPVLLFRCASSLQITPEFRIFV